MAEHTPGPWEVEERGASVWADGQQVAQTAASPGVGMEIHWDMNQRLANARLIAAAPELLEAVECFLRTWEKAGPLGSHQFEKFDTAVRLANIAYEKATAQDYAKNHANS